MQAFADFADNLFGGAILVALSLCLGSVAWGLVVLRPWQRENGDPLLARCTAILTASAAALALLQGTSLALKALVIEGSIEAALRSDLASISAFRAGAARVLAAALLALASWRLTGRPRSGAWWSAVSLGAALTAVSGAWLVHGAGRLEYRGLLMASTVAHQVGGAVWVGALLQLAAAWQVARRQPAARALWPTLLARFSRLAVAGVALMLLASVPLVWAYVGSFAGLIGTGYGSLLTTKVLLFAGALGLAAVSRAAVRRWRVTRDETAAVTTAPFFVGAEALLAVGLLFLAATLASQPPAVDIVAERATWPEVMRVFAPKWPQLNTPSVAAMRRDTSDPLAVVGGERTVAAYSWSNFSHNVAGLVLLAVSLVALLGDRLGAGLSRHAWPLGFVVLGVFVFLRTSANSGVWPFGPGNLWTSTFGDAEVLQHRLGALIVVTLGLVEWWGRTHPGSRLALVLPALAASGGVLLLTHAHAAFEPKSYYLIQITHTAMGALAVLMAGARWLELRLAPPSSRWAGLAAYAAMLLIALVLVFYQEANVEVPPI